jgi:tetratricopeptide (TPR) repeat protein
VARDLQLRIGVLAFADGRAADAKAAWSEARRLSPKDAALRRQIAEALASRGAFGDAVAELRGIEPLLGADAAARVALLRREAELQRRATPSSRAEAATTLTRAFRIASEAHDAALEGECASELLRLYGVRPPRARVPDELTRLVARAESQDPAAAALVAEVLAASGDPGALAAFRRADAARPGDAWVLGRLCALEHGDAQLRDLATLAGLSPDDAAVQLERLRALLAAGRNDEAAAVAKAIAVRFSESPPVLDELTRILMERGRAADALPAIERLLALDPDRADAKVRHGDALRALGRDADGSRAYFAIVARDRSPAAYRQLVEILERRKLTPEVKRAYLEALARNDDPTLRRDYARWLSAHNALDDSMAEWKKLRDTTRDGFLKDYAERELKRLEVQSMLNR